MGRVLITGAAGFIGRHLLCELRGRHEIFAMARSARRAADAGVSWIEQDLTRPLDRSRLPEELDAVIHLAQSRHYRSFPERGSDIFAVNVESTFRLLEYARSVGCPRFVLASSGGVYGYGYERLTEADPVNPLDFYLSSKYMAELLTANYRTFFDAIVFRFFFAYGRGQAGMLVPRLVERVRRGEKIVVDGNPGLKINPIHVSDAVRVFEPALRLHSSELFNVAGDEVVTITELVHLIQRQCGRDTPVEHTEGGADGDLIGDNTRMKQVLGVLPRTTLSEGVRDLVQASDGA